MLRMVCTKIHLKHNKFLIMLTSERPSCIKMANVRGKIGRDSYIKDGKSGYSLGGSVPFVPMTAAQWRMRPKTINFSV